MKEEVSLVQKAQDGNADAFGSLYDVYLPKIYRFVYFRVGSKREAEDITHQTFLKAWEGIQSFKFQGFPFSSWLYRIARNTIIDFYRTEKTTENIDEIDEAMIAGLSDDEKNLDEKKELGEILKALRELKPDEQAVVTMKFVDELPAKEISLALGKSEVAVRVMQHRAIKRLKEIIQNGR